MCLQFASATELTMCSLHLLLATSGTRRQMFPLGCRVWELQGIAANFSIRVKGFEIRVRVEGLGF